MSSSVTEPTSILEHVANGKQNKVELSDLADLLPEIVFETNLQGRFTFVNQKGFKITGYTQDDLNKGLTVLDIVVPEDRNRIKENFKRVLSGERSSDNEYTILKKDGTAFPVVVSSIPIVRDSRTAGLRGIALDITERRKMEDALRASEENYRNISRKMSALMRSSAMLIHTSNLRDQLRTIVDAVCEQGWGRAVISLKDENLNTTDLVTAGLTHDEEEHLRKHQASGEVWRQLLGPTFRHYRLGESYYLPWSDPLVRKQFKNAIRSNVSREETVDWDPDDLLFVPLRLPDGQIVGIMSIDDPRDGRRPTKESLAPLELFAHQAAVAIENAKLIQHLNEVKNELREYAERLEEKVEERTTQLKQAQQQLLKSERLAAIGELAAMVGHDLRNPLTGIAGAAYYLRTKYASSVDDKGIEMLEIIEKDIEYSNKIINDLLEYSREMKLELSEATPKSILKKALSSLKVPRNIRVLDRTQEELSVSIDKEKMRRVFVNIIKNAMDAMPKGGILTVESKVSKGNLEITFSDTGAGMSKETLKKMWRPLFTTKAKGMGFGLPICKRIVEAHGGRISIESAAGKGSAFTVSIPTNLL